MPNFSDRVHRIADKGSSAWDIHYAALAAVQTDPSVIVLSVGDPDFPTPAHIVDASYASAQAGDTHYTPILGVSELRDAIAQKLNAQRTYKDITLLLLRARRMRYLPRRNVRWS